MPCRHCNVEGRARALNPRPSFCGSSQVRAAANLTLTNPGLPCSPRNGLSPRRLLPTLRSRPLRRLKTSSCRRSRRCARCSARRRARGRTPLRRLRPARLARPLAPPRSPRSKRSRPSGAGATPIEHNLYSSASSLTVLASTKHTSSPPSPAASPTALCARKRSRACGRRSRSTSRAWRSAATQSRRRSPRSWSRCSVGRLPAVGGAWAALPRSRCAPVHGLARRRLRQCDVPARHRRGGELLRHAGV